MLLIACHPMDSDYYNDNYYDEEPEKNNYKHDSNRNKNRADSMRLQSDAPHKNGRHESSVAPYKMNFNVKNPDIARKDSYDRNPLLKSWNQTTNGSRALNGKAMNTFDNKNKTYAEAVIGNKNGIQSANDGHINKTKNNNGIETVKKIGEFSKNGKEYSGNSIHGTNSTIEFHKPSNNGNHSFTGYGKTSATTAIPITKQFSKTTTRILATTTAATPHWKITTAIPKSTSKFMVTTVKTPTTTKSLWRLTTETPKFPTTTKGFWTPTTEISKMYPNKTTEMAGKVKTFSKTTSKFPATTEILKKTTEAPKTITKYPSSNSGFSKNFTETQKVTTAIPNTISKWPTTTAKIPTTTAYYGWRTTPKIPETTTMFVKPISKFQTTTHLSRRPSEIPVTTIKIPTTTKSLYKTTTEISRFLKNATNIPSNGVWKITTENPRSTVNPTTTTIKTTTDILKTTTKWLKITTEVPKTIVNLTTSNVINKTTQIPVIMNIPKIPLKIPEIPTKMPETTTESDKKVLVHQIETPSVTNGGITVEQESTEKSSSATITLIAIPLCAFFAFITLLLVIRRKVNKAKGRSAVYELTEELSMDKTSKPVVST